jgi:hypothetical protein
MATSATFSELVAEGAAEPVEGWDFSWFEGRASEERPAWGYARLLAERMGAATAALDIQTGGGEVLAGIPHPPPVLAATESWPPNIELARLNLRPGGTYFSQQVGAGSNRELTDFMMGPQPVGQERSPQRARAQAQDAGLAVIDLREQALRVQFLDVGAVVYFLRKVLWTVPGFTVDRYRDRLARLHDQIQAEGAFGCHAQRFLIEARKPA